jgi:hypothetical protein
MSGEYAIDAYVGSLRIANSGVLLTVWPAATSPARVTLASGLGNGTLPSLLPVTAGTQAYVFLRSMDQWGNPQVRVPGRFGPCVGFRLPASVGGQPSVATPQAARGWARLILQTLEDPILLLPWAFFRALAAFKPDSLNESRTLVGERKHTQLYHTPCAICTQPSIRSGQRAAGCAQAQPSHAFYDTISCQRTSSLSDQTPTNG